MKGLNCNFQLSNGRFVLNEGVEKSRDAIWFYGIFDKFRVYTSDFGANFVSLVQKPISTLLLTKTLLIGKIKKEIEDFVPSVRVKNVDIGYIGKEREDVKVLIEYSSVLDNKTEIEDVTFV